MDIAIATPLRGPALLRIVVNQILAHPETWDQTRWHCGTTHCVGGWCQVLGEAELEGSLVVNGVSAVREVRDLLGISDDAALWLTACDRTLREIYGFAKLIADPNYNDVFNYRASNYLDGRDENGSYLELNPLPE